MKIVVIVVAEVGGRIFSGRRCRLNVALWYDPSVFILEICSRQFIKTTKKRNLDSK